jgi:hypothetical protein
MVSVTIQGGLGNQLFQFAVAYNLARHLNSELQVELSFFEDQKPREDFTPRRFLLNEMGIHTHKLGEDEWRRRKKAPDFFSEQSWVMYLCSKFLGQPKKFVEKLPSFDPALFSVRGNVHLEGYFQDYRYLGNVGSFIRECINRTIPVRDSKQDVPERGAICMHMRRGDYLSRQDVQALMGHCDVAYYRRALSLMYARGISAPVYIFSDDRDYAREVFEQTPGVKVWGEASTPEATLDDFMMMMRCKHFIISNSSYSYWAAWLGGGVDSVICYPKPWYNKYDWREYTPAPPNWTAIDRY